VALDTCSFCGRSESQAKLLVPGPGVFICDECIELSYQILHELPAADRGNGGSGAVVSISQFVD